MVTHEGSPGGEKWNYGGRICETGRFKGGSEREGELLVSIDLKVKFYVHADFISRACHPSTAVHQRRPPSSPVEVSRQRRRPATAATRSICPARPPATPARRETGPSATTVVTAASTAEAPASAPAAVQETVQVATADKAPLVGRPIKCY